MLTTPGTYNDVTSGPRGLIEKESGCVQLGIPCNVPDGSTITAYLNIILKDGTLSERTIKSLKEAVGWDGIDIDALETADWPAFQIVVGEESYNGKMQVKVMWINPNNSEGRAGVERTEGVAQRMKAMYGAKLRALSGGNAPARPAAPKPPVAAPKPPPPPPPPSGKTSTMEACWDAFCKANSSKTELDLYAAWPKAIAEATNGKAQNDCTPEDWGEVLFRIENF